MSSPEKGSWSFQNWDLVLLELDKPWEGRAQSSQRAGMFGAGARAGMQLLAPPTLLFSSQAYEVLCLWDTRAGQISGQVLTQA